MPYYYPICVFHYVSRRSKYANSKITFLWRFQDYKDMDSLNTFELEGAYQSSQNYQLRRLSMVPLNVKPLHLPQPSLPKKVI